MGLVTVSHHWQSVSLQQRQLDLRILLRPGLWHITNTYNHPTALEVEKEAISSFTTLMHPRLAPVTSTLQTLELVSAKLVPSRPSMMLRSCGMIIGDQDQAKEHCDLNDVKVMRNDYTQFSL